MTHPRFDALILNGNLRQALVAVRSLGRRGLRVALAGSSRDYPAFASRYCAEGFEFPAEESANAYSDRLKEWLEEHGARVVIPSHDGSTALLRRHRAALESHTRLAIGSERSLEIAVSKERTLAAAAAVGIRVPGEFIVRDPSDLAAAIATIGFPAVIKPNESWLTDGHQGQWAGPTLVVNVGEAEPVIAKLTRFGGSALFQQFLPGRRDAVSFIYDGRRFHARFAQWAQRTRPPVGGESVLRQAIAIPSDIGDVSEALIREIGLEGYSEVEFRRDAAGVPYMMEINPRLSASVEVAVRAGVDFPLLLYQWAAGAPIESVSGYREGGWMRHLGGDVETTLAALEERGRPGVSPPARVLLDFGLAFFKVTGYDYLDWRDPRPALRATSRYSGRLFERILSRTCKAIS